MAARASSWLVPLPSVGARICSPAQIELGLEPVGDRILVPIIALKVPVVRIEPNLVDTR
jgi:hypothetical protein